MSFVWRVDGRFARLLSIAAASALAVVVLLAGSARAALPTGEVYVGNNDSVNPNNTVLQFSYNSTGALTPYPYPSAPAGSTPQFLALTPNGKFLYVANDGNNTVSQYAVDPSGLLAGMLVPLSSPTVPAGCEPTGLAVNHVSTFVYVANACDNTLGVYKIATTGALSQIQTIATGAHPVSVAVAPDDKAVYVGSIDDDTISQYTAATNGTLTANGTAANLPGGTCAWGLAVSPNSRSVYVADFCDGFLDHLVAATNGALTFADLKGGSPDRFTSVAVAPTGKTVYGVDGGNNLVRVYSANTTGAITPVETIAAGAVPVAIGVSPGGKSAYVVNNQDGTISEYTVGTTGLLTALGTVDADPGAWGIAVRK